MGSPGDEKLPDVERARFRSLRTADFTESVIREMTRLALEHRAVNLAQGMPDFAAPEVLKEAARQAITADINQYAITWGAKPFRDAIAGKYQRWYGIELDPKSKRATSQVVRGYRDLTGPGH